MGNRVLPGIPVGLVLDRLAKAGGNEIESGKLISSESSAALAVNTFGWFIERPNEFPLFPGCSSSSPAIRVDVEYSARFPWNGGRHPWLDAVVETDDQLIGVESKRFEPYRDRKSVALSAAYDRPVWGDQMKPIEAIRDKLRSGELRFDYLDAAQLVKHAFGLVTDGVRKGKNPVLMYLFAEPPLMRGKPISLKHFERHRAEITLFSEMARGSAVSFQWQSYRNWLNSWPLTGPVRQHGAAILERFTP